MTTYYFGERWDAPAFDDAIERPTPVGDSCQYCAEDVVDGDSGTWQVFGLATGAVNSAIHIECWVRVMGSPAHCRGECACSGGQEPADDRTWREQGREVMRMVREGRGMFAARLFGPGGLSAN